MDIVIAGPGEVVLRFIDDTGRTLMQEKLVVSGSPSVQARRTIALHAETTRGRVQVSPVLVRQSNPQQRVTFDGEPPSRFTVRRCREIGCPTDLVSDLERGCVTSAIVPGETAMLLSDDQTMYRVIQEAVGKKRGARETEEEKPC